MGSNPGLAVSEGCFIIPINSEPSKVTKAIHPYGVHVAVGPGTELGCVGVVYSSVTF